MIGCICLKHITIGGSDQMGNMMSGFDLISKIYQKRVYGLTLPLITSEMGDKFGKSAGNAVWLSPNKTSPFTFYQFWVRMSDADAEKMLKLFTFDSLNSIKDLVQRHKQKPEERLAQKKLAEYLTTLVHGAEGLQKAHLATQALYKGSTNAINSLSVDEIKSLFEGATVVEIMPEPGQDVLNVAMEAGCFPTKSKRLK
ncbi:tyrosine--tRNA ligase, mitochondrial isoform X2 [Agrilus planipennis]|uniref:tyrosine--tRNA ligase n=1 Tax=Agrilus planipennis TaxID=224129 RepID=A0A1W4WGS7_AGRPL|nr:tyrosine--tRNA ligase, mitochondrial isoform X2 [Agrilus planipennis]